MWARVQDGLCAEFTTTDPEGRFPPDLVWVAVPVALSEWVDVGCPVDADGKLEPPLDGLKATLLRRLAERRRHQQQLGVVVGGRRFQTDHCSHHALHLAVTMRRGKEALTWKTLDGFADLSVEEAHAALRAVTEYVQRVFDCEAAIARPILAADSWQAAIGIYCKQVDFGWPDSALTQPPL